jgi:hypothetical protein
MLGFTKIYGGSKFMYEVDEYTVPLLHFEDGLKDECGNAWTKVGDRVISSDQEAVGNSSLYTPAKSFLTSTNNGYVFGNGDSTIDFWMYYESGYSGITSAEFDSSNGIFIQSVGISFGNNTYSTAVITKTPGFIPNEWAHYALVRKSGTVYWFQKGQFLKYHRPYKFSLCLVDEDRNILLQIRFGFLCTFVGLIVSTDRSNTNINGNILILSLVRIKITFFSCI